jgi:hypothetical protein
MFENLRVLLEILATPRYVKEFPSQLHLTV